MEHECKVEEWTTRPTMSIRTRSSVKTLGKTLADAYGRIGQYLGELGEPPIGPPYTAYYNEDMEDMDVEIGMPVSKKLPGRGDIDSGEMPQGQVATCLYIGPYTDISPSYAALSEWVKEHGYEVTGVAYEVYLDDPSLVPPNELKTQIAFLLKAAEKKMEKTG